MDFSVEAIPNEDQLYCRVHKTYIKSDKIEPSAFTNRPKGSNSMSVDWAKYTTPQETRARARAPSENAVVQFQVADVRALPGQKVEHMPLQDNQAHSGVIGEK